MADIIQQLPDSVANQIAAGEVVQRPASVIKELVENAIDAQATEITIKVVDAGRTSIQIIDNGLGMSETDARMSFERHATSKIRSAKDIFHITSMGFRGEALASIAAVSQVELKSKKEENELGTKIIINGSTVESQEPVSCKNGTSFQVKNLFYNIPARRKFMKSNQTEFKYILSEINHTALSHCNISFTIYKDDSLYAKYPQSNLKQRIVAIFGKRFEKALLPIESETTIAKIYGFVGTPDMAKKNNFDQYFFVNNRYFKQRSFQSAVMRAYENLLSSRDYPPFFVFLDVAPDQIDVNIHPTKTEIKFVEEYNICQIIEAAAKHSLGKSNIVPSLDFMDDTDYNDMFSASSSKQVSAPTIDVNPSYNPFSSGVKSSSNSASYSSKMNTEEKVQDWEKLFEEFESTPEPDIPQQTFSSAINSSQENDFSVQASCIQVQKKYIVTQGKSGLLVVDIKRAHSRILYEKFVKILQSQSSPSQKTLIPIQIETSHKDFETLQEILPELQAIGFDIEEFGKNSFVIHGCPPDIEISHVESIIQDFMSEFDDNQKDIKGDVQNKIAVSLAKTSALYRNVSMQQDEMQAFIAQLFQCEQHSLSAEGKLAVILIDYDELFKKFN